MRFSRDAFLGTAIGSPRKMGQGGFIFGGLGIMFIVGVVGLILFSLIAAISFVYLASVLALVIIMITIIGTFKYKLPFHFVIIIASICAGLITAVEVGIIAAAGVSILGFALYGIAPGKPLWLSMGLVGIGLLTIIWGTKFILIPLGVLP